MWVVLLESGRSEDSDAGAYEMKRAKSDYKFFEDLPGKFEFVGPAFGSVEELDAWLLLKTDR